MHRCKYKVNSAAMMLTCYEVRHYNDGERKKCSTKGAEEGIMTQLWRLSTVMPREMEAQLMELRKTDEFCRGSISRMVRVLLEEAIAARKEKHDAEQ